MNLTQLRAFDAVVREGGFTRAAAALSISQPAVTVHVKALEEAYGVRLLVRRGRSVEPTEMGRRLAEVARRLFRVEEEARDLLGSAGRLTTGSLRIGADGAYDVLPILAAFKARHPRVEVRLAVGNTEVLLESLMAEESDIAVLGDAPDSPLVTANPALHAVPFAAHPLVVFVPADHPWVAAGRSSIRLSELRGRPMVLREPGSATRRAFLEACARAGVEPEVALEIGNREAVKEVVAAGLGIGVVSLGELGRDDRLRPLAIEDAGLVHAEFVVCLAARRRLRVVRAFLDLAAATAGGL